MGLGLSLGVMQASLANAPSLSVVTAQGAAPYIREASPDPLILQWSFAGTVQPSGALVRRQWLRNGLPVTGETGLTYTVGSQDGGAGISVQTIFSASGYAPYALNSNIIQIALQDWAFLGDLVQLTPTPPAPPRVAGAFIEV